MNYKNMEIGLRKKLFKSLIRSCRSMYLSLFCAYRGDLTLHPGMAFLPKRMAGIRFYTEMWG